MEQNSLIEIGSKGNVILRFLAQTTINGKTYAAQEPYLFLKDVSIIINYKKLDKSNSAGANKIANTATYPQSISVLEAPFSRKLCSLLAAYVDDGLEYNPTIFKTLTAETGIIYLPEEVKESGAIYAYDEDFDSVVFTYNSVLNALESESFVEDTDYLISYSSVKTGTKFNLIQPCYPYMSMEIQGIGNIDKSTKRVIMYFEKVSLNSLLEFNFIQNNRINTPLEFHIIDGINYVIFED